jgi:xylan 1,4-beta-xylosidase
MRGPKVATGILVLSAFASGGSVTLANTPTPAAASGATAVSATHAAEHRQVTVDASRSIGTIRSLQGVNGAPAPGMHKPIRFQFGGWNVPAETDATPGYRQARIDLIRTHDAYGPGDIDARFPEGPGVLIDAERTLLSLFPNPDADPKDPKSYNFGPTDELIASIKGLGAEVIFRLGRSEGSNVDPPKDFDKYAEVAKHVVLHYNKGWANGFRYNIRYWEVWNEPDLGRLFWGGTAQEWFTLYEKIVKAVKQADRRALVGGPAIARVNDRDNPYFDEFLRYVRDRKLPLDFFSWHWYATDSNDPQDIVRIGREVRARLDQHGFKKALSMLNEWNYGLLEPMPGDLQRAAFITSTLLYMQDAPIDISALYRADNVFGPKGVTPHKTGHALIAMGRMQETPVRLAAQGADNNGFAVQAGRTKKGDRLHVLISNYEIPKDFLGPRKGPNALTIGNEFSVALLERRSLSYERNRGYSLAIDKLPAGQEYTVQRYRISAQDNLSLIDTSVQSGPRIQLDATLPPPAIELVVLERR